jgi:hypothetical protein
MEAEMDEAFWNELSSGDSPWHAREDIVQWLEDL